MPGVTCTTHHVNSVVKQLQDSCRLFKLFAELGDFSSFFMHRLIRNSPPRCCQVKDLSLRGAEEPGHVPKKSGANEYQIRAIHGLVKHHLQEPIAHKVRGQAQRNQAVHLINKTAKQISSKSSLMGSTIFFRSPNPVLV
jgi:hypothetical protein